MDSKMLDPRNRILSSKLSSFPYSQKVHRAEGIIYMVLECGEIDLARLLQKREAARREQGAPVSSLDENFIRLYWEQMLTVRICMLCHWFECRTTKRHVNGVALPSLLSVILSICRLSTPFTRNELFTQTLSQLISWWWKGSSSSLILALPRLFSLVRNGTL